MLPGRVLGPQSLGGCNDNGIILRTRGEHRLLRTNTFRQEIKPRGCTHDRGARSCYTMLLSEVRSTGRAGYQGDPRCRWLDGSPPPHLQDEAPTSTTQKALS
ncbi:unnamed protein product [Schistocephalus solidus]|uniref:Uncharacterized protein n=1 Tax=Schistocephalus solidus TaxID=70667 RepID=A0A183TQB5_SCHSO|nr:unnamed protein product [Schistocephalus solidus]